VALSQAPSAPLTVSIATEATTKLGISVPTLSFTPANFDQPQTVTVTGLSDPDTVDEHAEIRVTASGVDPVAIATTVHDLDKVTIVVGGANPLMVNEGNTAAINVHLSAQPSGDVAVSAMIASGPVTVSPATRVFTAANYRADQVFTITAVPDADTIENDQLLTFSATGVADQVLAIQDLDRDTQSIVVQVNPANLTITEETTTATIDVALSQQPSRNVLVTVTASGQAHVDIGQLTFTPQNYATNQRVTVDAPGDPDTVDGSGTVALHATDPDKIGNSLDRSVTLTVKDNDQQAILEDAASPLLLSETTGAMFGATLAFQPTQNVVVNVSSLDSGVATAAPGTLTFTPTDYNLPHTVTVTGVHDTNLAVNTTSIRLFQSAIGAKDVPVSVADVDHQAIVLAPSSLSIPEGTSRTFDVSLMFDPGAPVTVSVANDNQAALPISIPPALPTATLSIPFTSANYATPVHVTVSPPVDINDVSETATITATGAGAPAPARLTASVMDLTVVKQYGFPTPFTGTASLSLGEVIAYRITTDATVTLDSFGVYIPAGTGDFRMAIYADGLNSPGALVAAMPVRQAITSGINTGNIPGVNLPIGSYWIAFRDAQPTTVGFATAGAGPACTTVTQITNLDAPWPSAFGNANCSLANFMNFFITTHHQ
jgi:hypothetical protein